MKIVLVLLWSLCSFSVAFSQDIFKEYRKLSAENDSLTKEVIKPLNDSIIKLNYAHNEEMSKLQEQIKILENDTIDLKIKVKVLESRVSNLDQNLVKVERDNLNKKVDSLSAEVKELEIIISQKEDKIDQEKQLCEQRSMKEKEKGKQEALNLIIQTYHKTFDELVISSTLKSVERDSSIVGDNIEVGQKLLSLQKYFFAEQILSEKYDEQKVITAQTQISGLDQTELVKNLNGKLLKYKLCNDGLKTTIDSILLIDKQFIGNDDYTREMKLQKILSRLAWYFRNYRFNFTDYPYLSEIVLEIIKLKQKDADTNISFLLNKL
jgi:hypothetical protein